MNREDFDHDSMPKRVNTNIWGWKWSWISLVIIAMGFLFLWLVGPNEGGSPGTVNDEALPVVEDTVQ